MESKRLVIYARVSTEGQAEDGFSIEAQVATIRSINESLGHKIVNEYIDRGISGKSMENRPALLQMLDDAQKELFDEVVVWKINRLARNHLDLLKIYGILERNEVSFRSITEPFDTSNPAGKLLFNLLASIGEFERETIVENVKSGMKQRAKQGLFNGGRMLGYRSEAVSNGKEKSQLIIVPEEAEIIKLIFDLYINGKGYKYIANILNDLGHKTLKEKNFSIQSVKTIVTNPTYAGKIRFNNNVNYSKNKRKGNDTELVLVDGNHDPIIDKETWNKAQEIFKRKSKKSRKIVKGIFLLTGLLKCPDCGASMVAGRVSKKDKDGNRQIWNYYQCSRYKNYGRNECSPNSIRADYAEEYVLKYLSDFALNDKLIESVVSRINRQVEKVISPIKSRLNQIEKEKKDFDYKKERVFSLYEENVIDQKTLRERLDKLQEQLNVLNELQINLENQINNSVVSTKIPAEHVKKLLKSFGSVLDISTREQKKLLLNLVIDRITVNIDRKIDQIELHFSENVQRRLIKEDSSDNEESSSFIPFSIAI